MKRFFSRSRKDLGLQNPNKGLEGSLSVNAEDGEGGRSADFRHGDGGLLLW